ncbi:tetratricopeptide repeat protein [Nodosilinea sp. LEGE 07298]|nr:tetratricopeptide repeat protein [Nodosilinea sp. LEGE 07298]
MVPITSAAGFSEELPPQAPGQIRANLLSASQNIEPGRLLQEGQALYYRGKFAEALEVLQVALAEYRALGDRPERYRGEVASLTAIAEVYLWQNRHDEALDLAQQALEIARTHQNDWGEVWALNIAGVAQRNLGQLEEAEASYQQALELGSTLEDKFPLNVSRLNLGAVYMAQGNIAAAREQFQQALAYLEQPSSSPELDLRRKYYQALTLQWAGLGALRAEEFDQALSFFEQSLTLGRAISNLAVEAGTLLSKGQLYQQRSKEALALEAYQQALSLYQTLGQPLRIGSTSFRIGRLYTEQDQDAQAVEAYQQSANAFEQAEDYDQQAHSLHWLGITYQSLEQYPQALAAYQQALELYRSEENRWYEADVLNSMGQVYYFQEKTVEAEAAYRQGLTIAQQISDRLKEAHALFGLGHTLIQQGNALRDTEAYEESRLVYQQSIELFQAARIIALELEDIQQEQNAIEGIIGSYLNLAWSYGYQNNYVEEVVASQRTLDLLETYRERLPETAFLERKMVALNNLGIAHSNAAQSTESIQASGTSAAIAEQLGNFDFQVRQLLSVAQEYARLDQYEQALLIGQQALKIAHDKLPQAEELELSLLLAIGKIYDDTRQYDVALEYYQQAGLLAQELDNPSIGNVVFNNIGAIHATRGQYLQALEPLQQAWEIDQSAIQQLQAEGLEAVERLCGESAASLGVRGQQNCLSIFQHRNSVTLNNLALVYHGLGRYSEAIEVYQQVLEFHRGISDRHNEMTALNNLGTVYASIGEYTQAIEVYQQSLQTARDINSRSQEATALNNLGMVYEQQGRYPEALELFQTGLAITQDIGDPSTEASLLAHIGGVYKDQGKLTEALDLYQTSLDIRQQLGEADNTNLNNMALIHHEQGHNEKALEYLYQALDITRTTGDRTAEASALGNIAALYATQADYAKALEVQQHAASIRQELGGGPNQVSALAGLGQIYVQLGQYDQALTYYQEALQISQEVGEKAAEMSALSWLGKIYQAQSQYELALEHLQKALRLAQDMGDVANEARGLVAIGRLHQLNGRFDDTIELLEQALKTQRQIGVRFDKGNTLTHLGLAYGSRGEISKAVEILQQAMAIHQETGELAKEAETLANLGQVLKATQPELAIVFYKQAVNLREGIRGSLRELSRDLQQSYTDSVADTYRDLADLLLEQGRIPEAQQVLDLLKLEELREFTHTTRATWTGSKLAYTNLEEPVIEAHFSLIAFGQRLYECQQTNCNQLGGLLDQQDQLIQAYNQQVRAFEATVRDNRYDDPLFQDPDNLSGAAQDLLAANPNSVLIYPFITEDKLWLLWAAGSAVGTVQVEVSQGELARTVQRFGELLTSGGNLAELQAASQQLYGWIVEPLEAELQRNNIQKLIFVNDRITRYIPMAALFDGEQFLIERYTLSTVISPALTDTEDRLTGLDESHVLGLGLSQPISGFTPLPAVEPELDNIILSDATDTIGIYPGQIYLNEAFTLDQLKDNVLNHRVLHIASHAAFVPGRKEDSFILLGDGQKLRVTDIDDMSGRLSNLHMVVLSACQTALGAEAGDGTEIAGISSYFLKTGRAKTVIASLWAVNDSSTSLLMQRFYELLASGELTKAEALRQAQLSLLYDEDSETRLAASRATIELESRPSQPISDTGFQHPYHWAPFILIGNGL